MTSCVSPSQPFPAPSISKYPLWIPLVDDVDVQWFRTFQNQLLASSSHWGSDGVRIVCSPREDLDHLRPDPKRGLWSLQLVMCLSCAWHVLIFALWIWPEIYAVPKLSRIWEKTHRSHKNCFEHLWTAHFWSNGVMGPFPRHCRVMSHILVEVVESNFTEEGINTDNPAATRL